MTPATARSRRRAHPRPAVQRAPRRISGPVAGAGAAALPRPRTGTTGLFARVRALPEHRVVDRLLRSRLWIWVLGVLLGGIVTMQVSLLKLNSGISRAVETTTTLERQNADLEASIARLSSPDRIESGATALGMVMAPAGDVGYLTARPGDASNAVRRMQPPSEEAAALLANAGIVPGSLADTQPAPVETAAPATTEAPAVATPAPVTTEPVAPAPTPDPAATAQTPTESAGP
jgi:cell division protein FtsL